MPATGSAHSMHPVHQAIAHQQAAQQAAAQAVQAARAASDLRVLSRFSYYSLSVNLQPVSDTNLFV